jgi:hypothetical protein
MRFVHMLLALLVNAVPVYGVYALGWSAATVLVLFWLENLLGGLVMMVRIALHRRLTRKRGHWMAEVVVNGVTKKTTYLSQFGMIAIIFTLAHGVFVGFFAFALGHNHPDNPAWQFDFAAFRLGAAGTMVFLVLDLLIDLPGLRQRSFAWMEGVAGRRLSRVLVLHLGLIFGMWAAAGSDKPMAMILVLIGIKTLIDLLLAGHAPDAHAQSKPHPPRWLSWFAEVTGANKKPGRDGKIEHLNDWWQRTNRETEAERVRKEEVLR